MISSELIVDRLKTAATIAVLGAIAIVVCYEIHLRNLVNADLEAFPRYTAGEVIKRGYVIGPSPHSATLFAYTVGDSTYIKGGPDELPDGQTRFLVKYSTQHPQYYKFYKQMPLLPTHIPPPEGWAEPPYRVPAEDLE